MVALGLLVIVVVLVIVVTRASRGAGDHPRPSRVARGPVLDEELARWVGAGLMTSEQATAILEHEHAHAVPVEEPAPVERVAHRPSVVPEALGYVGGVLALAGLVLVVSQLWSDIETGGRLALSGGAMVGLVVAGALVRAEASPALARLRSFLWLVSTGAAVVLTAVLVIDGLGSDAPETVALSCGAVVATESALLRWWRDRPVQQLTFLAGVAVAAGAVVAELAAGAPVGIAVWLVGTTYLALGLRRRIPEPPLTESVGAAATLVGAAITIGSSPGPGIVFVLATALALVGLAVVPGLAPVRSDQLVVGVIGSIGLVQALPSTIGYFGQDAGGVTGLVTWVVGAILVLAAVRRLVRLPDVVQAAGSVAVIGGAALTGVQWHGFAPLFGIATAAGLFVLGARVDQPVLSVFGLLGLLINVPWAVGWYFPGEARAPLVMVVAGAILVAIAVYLTRRGGGRVHPDRRVPA